MTLFYKYMRPLIENGHLYISEPPLFAVTTNPRTKKEKKMYAWSKDEVESITNKLKEKYEVTRYKGLGEMDYRELKESTMNNSTRRLIQVSIEDIEEAEKILSTCMYDKDIKNRKAFLIENKPGREDEIDE